MGGCFELKTVFSAPQSAENFAVVPRSDGAKVAVYVEAVANMHKISTKGAIARLWYMRGCTVHEPDTGYHFDYMTSEYQATQITR